MVALMVAALSLAACRPTPAANVVEPPTTAPPTATSTTTTPAAAGAAGALNGADDTSVLNRLQGVATAELTLYVNSQRFSADSATLSSVEPGVAYGSGLAPPVDPAAVNVVTSGDSQWACLIGRSTAGHVFVLVVGPPANVYQGSVPLAACDAAAAQKLKLVTG